jgi:hypothetical protein
VDAALRELLIARISSGRLRLRIGRKSYSVRPVTLNHKYLANELYFQQLKRGKARGLFNDNDLLAYMLSHGLWDESRQKYLKDLPGEIEQFKVALYEKTFRSNELKSIRKSLAIAKAKFEQVETERHTHDYLSAAGAASLAKSRYLLGMSLWRRGCRVFTTQSYWEYRGTLLEDAVAVISKAKLGEAQYRELARTEPWASTWRARKTSPMLFPGLSAAEYSDEQRTLVSMSMLYDYIYEHPERPDESVIDDDDMLDGWLILQRRGAKKSNGPSTTNDKIRNSQEVFFPADTHEDAQRVMDMNDAGAKRVLKRRFEHLRKHGKVEELDMPDTALRLRAEAVEKLSRTAKGQ